MKWSYQSYDVKPTDKHLTKDLIAKILNDHYSDYNPLCMHTSIQRLKDGTSKLFVYFPTETKNVSKLPEDHKGTDWFYITIPTPVSSDEIPQKLEAIPLEPDQYFATFAWTNGYPKEGDFRGNIQEWDF